ncbi:hypothetical protein [Agarivorans sp. 1_MG-2023]|uniref:hypothetical protein n=1 Tax=Agarivorans sp. 1_MG-2023 TaxID=3062634 RepID=UPI0026E211A3|nr:hypothetical protein [Agarivorans sp. 1_MG-2023]MDO6765958.1 hypothetical protein [Agarivorans sp. 1_MG-2023]
MRAVNTYYCLFVLVVSTVFCSFPSIANELDSLIANKQLEVRSWVALGDSDEPSDKVLNVAVKQQAVLYIEVATTRWFTGGTRIGNIDVPNLIAKQRNLLATNYTERRNGETWSRQRWELTLYPQASGEYTLPAIPLQIKVSTAPGKEASGFVYTQPHRLNAMMPTGLLNENDQWAVASDIEISQEWVLSNSELVAGDAITRRVQITGQNTLSILLPNLLDNELNQLYQMYPKPNHLNDSSARGDYRSLKQQEQVYLLQSGGELVLPPLTLSWWDTSSNSLKVLSLPGRSFSVKHSLSSWLRAHQYGLTVGLVVLLAAAMLLWRIGAYYRHHPLPSNVMFVQALVSNNQQQLRRLVYLRLTEYSATQQLSEYLCTDKWARLAEQAQQTDCSRLTWWFIWRQIRPLKANKLAKWKALPSLQKPPC